MALFICSITFAFSTKSSAPRRLIVVPAQPAKRAPAMIHTPIGCALAMFTGRTPKPSSLPALPRPAVRPSVHAGRFSLGSKCGERGILNSDSDAK